MPTLHDAKLRHAAYYEGVLHRANQDYLQGEEAVGRGLALFDLERANVVAGQGWAAKVAETDDEAAQLCIDYPIGGEYVLDLRERPRVRIRWLEAALIAARRLMQRGAQGFLLNNLGEAYAALGEAGKAIEFYEQALVIFRECGE